MNFIVGIVLAVLALASVEAGTRKDDKWPPKDLVEKIKPIGEICRGKTGVTEDAIVKFSDGEIHEDGPMKCYMNCLFHQFQLVDDNGEVHFDTIQFHVDKMDEEFKAIATPLIQKCQNPEGADQCERAFWIHKCWKQTDPHHYFLV